MLTPGTRAGICKSATAVLSSFVDGLHFVTAYNDFILWCSFNRIVMSQTRKLWSQESMEAAVQSVQEGKGLREASRLYNVPVETLRQRVTGKVELDCRPGPPTVLTQEEEGEIVRYLIQMADMGYGLTKEAVMYMVGAYVTKCK